MKKVLAILVCLTAVLSSHAQQVGENKSGRQATPTFQVSSQLVIETVTVTDKNGAALEGLKAEDFSHHRRRRSSDH